MDGIRTEGELDAYANDLADLPRFYNGMLRPTQEIEKMSFNINITGNTLGVIFNAVQDSLKQLKDTGTVDRSGRRDGLTDLLGLQDIRDGAAVRGHGFCHNHIDGGKPGVPSNITMSFL